MSALAEGRGILCRPHSLIVTYAETERPYLLIRAWLLLDFGAFTYLLNTAIDGRLYSGLYV